MASAGCHFHGEAGKRITILSIDGGGVRGLIAARVLEFLEKQLQDLDGPNARIADYFDVVAGTSTGGLIAAMLTSPNGQGRPLFTAQDVSRFYMDYAHIVFPQKLPGILGSTENLLSLLSGPKYSPKNLEEILSNKLQNIKASDTVTELLIPAFDIKIMQPTFFSTSEAREDALKNAYLRDVCRGTSAAPPFFPPYFFRVDGPANGSREYNLVDGAMAVNNPTYLSIIHVLKEQFKGNDRFCGRMENRDYRSLLVLSLGTGTRLESYTAQDAAHWGALSWILKDGRSPITDLFLSGNADMVDFNLSVVFQTLQCPENYLRIQAINLPTDLASIDNSTSSNLQGLSDVGTQLLDKQVTSLDIDSGQYVPQPDRGTNRKELARFAQELVAEKQARVRGVQIS